MMDKSLGTFRPSKDMLVCIDSDGCAFDVMEVKHKECFCPATVKYWNLQAVSRYAREAWEFVNLYSVDRGINRFLALDKVLDLVEQRAECRREGIVLPDHSALKAWTRSGEQLNNLSLETHRGDPEMERILEWSLDCNRRIQEMVYGVPPFPCVRESLEALSQKADIVIVSATSTEALMREWEEHGLISLVSAVCGQEAGSKAHCISKAMEGRDPGRCLMIGDAPGDRAAAEKNGILFYPIRPLKEAESWEEFHRKYLHLFLTGTYQGEAQQMAVERFERLLPHTPPWFKTAGD